MLNDVFLFQVLLSFVVGGFYIAFMTLLSEKFGSKLGGLLIGLPSIVLVGLIFIAITQDQDALLKATEVMPASIAASTIFLASFILLFKRGLLIAYFCSVLIWFGLNLPWVLVDIHQILASILVAVILFSTSISYFHRHPHRKVEYMPITKKALFFRVVFSGSFIALAVFLAKVLGPTWGGLFASFPAAFSAAVLLFANSRGIEFTASVSRTMVNGALANVVFVISIFLLVPEIGVIFGIVLAYLICLSFAYISFKYLIPKM